MLVLKRCDRVSLRSGLKPTFRAARLSTDSIRITPTGPHKIVPLAADGVENIYERPCRYQVVGRFGGRAVERAALRYL